LQPVADIVDGGELIVADSGNDRSKALFAFAQVTVIQRVTFLALAPLRDREYREALVFGCTYRMESLRI
jgi:hypothetical protein